MIFVNSSTNVRVEISEVNRSSVLFGLLAGSGTASMNALTATAIYSFYGRLTMKGINLETLFSPADAILFYNTRNLQHEKGTIGFAEPCGMACPGILRRVRGSRGIIKFIWNDVGPGQFPLEHEPYEWRIGYRCWNTYCPYYGITAADERPIFST